jgi:hypothetical protein
VFLTDEMPVYLYRIHTFLSFPKTGDGSLSHLRDW